MEPPGTISGINRLPAAESWRARNATGLTLSGEFELRLRGRLVILPHSVERVVAYLALADRAVSRVKLANTLWLDCTTRRAANNLRTALWRLQRAGGRVVQVLENRLYLSPDLAVDMHDLQRITQSFIDDPEDPGLDAIHALVEGAELLPDWDDDWVVAGRERYRQLRLQALERAVDALIARGELANALDAALAAVASDPLRESARRLLIRIHLDQGNRADAVRVYEDFRETLADEVGLEPSDDLDTLMAPLRRPIIARRAG